jgi:hypothetical protein
MIPPQTIQVFVGHLSSERWLSSGAKIMDQFVQNSAGLAATIELYLALATPVFGG